MNIKGYLNKVKLNQEYSKKFSNPSGLLNETLVYDKLNIPYKVKGNVVKREIFNGNIIETWNQKQKNSLIKEIEKFHSIPKENFCIFDWNKYNNFSFVLTQNQFIKFKNSIKKIKKTLVPSHNDINGHNVLWDGTNIKLIDFEWSTLNHPYFDYVNFYIHENIKLREDLDKKEWNLVLYISLCFFIMWAEKHPKSNYVKQLKDRYIVMLNSI